MPHGQAPSRQLRGRRRRAQRHLYDFRRHAEAERQDAAAEARQSDPC
jgi:hypothetical protein